MKKQKLKKKQQFCGRKNFKLFSAGIVLAVGVSNLYISSNDAILPRSPPWAT